ncbi:MAG: hypothetical protein ABFD50_13390 [Smithella sp.]
MKRHTNQGRDLLLITFDDEKTGTDEIINELKKGKFKINGDPAYLK